MNQSILKEVLRFCFFILLVLNATLSRSQAPATNAQTQVIPYTSPFLYGENSGYYGNNWNDTTTAIISRKAGCGSLRLALYDFFLEQYGDSVNLKNYQFYQRNNLVDNTIFLNGAAADHLDNTIYNSPIATWDNPNPVSSSVFKNLYEPIWGADSNVNPNNYFAAYVYSVVKVYGKYTRFYEVWNEPDAFSGIGGVQAPGQPGNWWENPPAPQDMYNLNCPIYYYIRMMRIAYEVVHKYSPNSYVCTGGIGFANFLDCCLRYSDNPVDGSVNQYYPYSGGAYFDVVSFHDYPLYNLHAYSNAIAGTIYFRHSDAAAADFVRAANSFKTVLSKYGYDGTVYPAKPLICTETNIASTKIVGDTTLTGTPQYQKNYMMKALVYAQKIGVRQVYPFALANNETDPNNATDANNWMGLYYDIENLQPGQEVLTPEGVGYKTLSALLGGYTYDSVATSYMGLVTDTTDGMAFTNGQNRRYIVWAKTHQDLNENVSYTYNLPSALSGGNVHVYSWDASSHNLKPATFSVKQINLTADPIILEGTQDAPSAPYANAGINHQTNIPHNSYLDGSGSYDPAGPLKNYAWKKLSGPVGDQIDSNFAAKTQVSFTQTGTYVYQLTVFNINGLSDSSSVTINVYPRIYPIKAIAYGDTGITIPMRDTLYGVSSTPTTGSTLKSYQWTKLSGPPSDSLINPTGAFTPIGFKNEGLYTYQLRVSDSFGAKDSTQIQVNVHLNPSILKTNTQLLVYPNPTSGNVSLYYDDDFSGLATISIYDISGTRYYSTQIYKYRSLLISNLDLSFLRPGFYLFTVEIIGKYRGFWIQKK